MVADEIAFLEKKGTSSADRSSEPAMYEKQSDDFGIPVDGFSPIDDDDLPF